MRIIFGLVITLVICPLLFAEMVTSPLSYPTISYQAEEGTIVKKGEILYKFLDWWQKNSIEQVKLEVKMEEAKLKNKKAEITRYSKLRELEIVSIADHENVVVKYYKSLFALDKKKLALKQLELELKHYIFRAPYDCKVKKNILCLYSGVDYGSKIMEIEPLK